MLRCTTDGNIKNEVFKEIEYSGTFIAFGSKNYGEDTGNSASTYKESQYVENLKGKSKKRIIRIRMIPFDEDFAHLQGRTFFGMNDMVLNWELGTPMPPDLPVQIMEGMGLPAERIALAKSNAEKRTTATEEAKQSGATPVLAPAPAPCAKPITQQMSAKATAASAPAQPAPEPESTAATPVPAPAASAGVASPTSAPELEPAGAAEEGEPPLSLDDTAGAGGVSGAYQAALQRHSTASRDHRTRTRGSVRELVFAHIVREHRSISAAASTLRETAKQAKIAAQEAAPDEQAKRVYDKAHKSLLQQQRASDDPQIKAEHAARLAQVEKEVEALQRSQAEERSDQPLFCVESVHLKSGASTQLTHTTSRVFD
jgi:hypothetical protein